MYSYQVEQAIKAAAVLHDGQLRKGAVPIPYITHLFSVMHYLSEFTDDEEVLVAALLHDTLEDTEYTVKELREDFGSTVADIVSSLTEPTEQKGRALSWVERKEAYINQLNQADNAAIMVAAADKIHNFRTLVEEYHHNHNEFLQDFGHNLDERAEAYAKLAALIIARLPESNLRLDFIQVYDAFAEFLDTVRETKKPNDDESLTK